jgi:AcrR family transcriptional regulator
MSSAVAGADTRERILAAAVRRISSEGIDGVRIARIAMDAGVSASLVHYHFDTREALLAQALAWSYEHVGRQRAEIEQDADATHAQRLGAIVDQCLPHTPELREDWVVWMELWLRGRRVHDVRRRRTGGPDVVAVRRARRSVRDRRPDDHARGRPGDRDRVAGP